MCIATITPLSDFLKNALYVLMKIFIELQKVKIVELLEIILLHFISFSKDFFLRTRHKLVPFARKYQIRDEFDLFSA